MYGCFFGGRGGRSRGFLRRVVGVWGSWKLDFYFKSRGNLKGRIDLYLENFFVCRVE